ncbi:MAG: hypothetical protein P4L35_19505 [Ignavibacteriaceae bacterium]|nr:hypothetical protein [Ignavibacteriaceae bacterium]
MTLEEFETTLYKLENVMYGHNYEVIFGIDIFENCSDIEEFKIR